MRLSRQLPAALDGHQHACSAQLIAGDRVVGVDALSGLTIADVLDTIAGSNGGPTLPHALVPGSPAVRRR